MPAKRRRQYGVAVLVVMLLGLSVSLGFAYLKISEYGDNTCKALQALSSSPFVKPANPAAHPGQEELWQNYIHVVGLKRKLGCTM